MDNFERDYYHVHTIEDEDSVCVTFDVPGFGRKELRVSIMDGSIFVEGNRIASQNNSISLNAIVPKDTPKTFFNSNSVTSSVRNGLLAVKFSKIKRESKRIEIKINDD